MKKYIVFDWDGTLHNTKRIYGESVRRAYSYIVQNNAASEKYISDDELTHYLGMTAKAMWDDFMPGLEKNIRAVAEKMVSDSMRELIYEGKAFLYDGALEALDKLKAAGYELIFLSNCKIAYLEAHRTFFELDKWFTDYYPAQKYDFIPKDEIMALLLKEHPGQHIMVGDRYFDILAGTKNGLKTIGCAYGFGTAEELADADIIINSVDELTDAVGELYR